jgi:hypothetical protein
MAERNSSVAQSTESDHITYELVRPTPSGADRRKSESPGFHPSLGSILRCMEEGRLVTLRAADILVNSLTRQIHDACGELFHQDPRSDGAPAPSAFGQAPDIASVSWPTARSATPPAVPPVSSCPTPLPTRVTPCCNVAYRPQIWGRKVPH